jgi:hypothetical protein
MGEPHLHVVDHDGVVTPPAAGGDATDGGTPNAPKTERAPKKTRPNKVVPTDRMSFEVQVKALNTICTASRGGTDPVDANRMAALMRISPATSPLNNAFFVDVGLLTKSGRGGYLPTDIALRFQQKFSFDPKAAPAILASAFETSWFYDAVIEAVTIGNTTREQMVQTLASVAGTDASYAVQYGMCIEWLEYVGLIAIEDGFIRLTSDRATARDTSVRTEERQEPIVDTRTDAPAGPTTQPGEPPTAVVEERHPARRPNTVVSLSISIDVTTEDLAKLSAEQIAALFDGVGKVAAVKAAIDAA